MPPARRAAAPSTEDLLAHLDTVVGRLERLGDRLESYIAEEDDQEGPDEHPAPAP